MQYTSNKNFKLPEYTDTIDIADLNENFSAIDTYLNDNDTAHSQLSAEIKKAAPRNLLDNSDFRNPVNQRGIASGATVSSGYLIDRWRSSGSTIVTFTPDGISLTANIFQYVESARVKEGVKYTLACKMDGEIICYVFTGGAGGGSWDGGLIVSYSANSGKYQVYITKANVVYEWIALYEGEYTAETLPEYKPKGYGAELAECQRYYYYSGGLQDLPAIVGSGKALYATITTPVNMRDVDTMTLTVTTYGKFYPGAIELSGDLGWYVEYTNANTVRIRTTTYLAESTANTAGMVQMSFNLSAELT